MKRIKPGSTEVTISGNVEVDNIVDVNVNNTVHMTGNVEVDNVVSTINNYKTEIIIIPSDSTSDLIDIREIKYLNIIVDDWDSTASLTIFNCDTENGEYHQLYDDVNIPIEIKMGPNRSVGIDVLAGVLAGCFFIRFASCAIGDPETLIEQTSEKTIRVLCKS